jgi:tetratricopeptide (TPR) repeat protein
MDLLLRLAVCFCILSAPGCGGSQISEVDLDRNNLGLEIAESLFRDKEFQKCIESVDAIINESNILQDSLQKAILLRSESNLMLGRIEKSVEDLNLVEQSGEQLEKVFELKYRIATSKGELAKAEEAYQNLLQINPSSSVR